MLLAAEVEDAFLHMDEIAAADNNDHYYFRHDNDDELP